MKNKRKITFVTLCLIIGIPLLFYGYLHFILYGDSWKEKTTPLPQESVRTLCKNFDLEKNSICAEKKPVYGPDFYNIIRDTFRPYEEYKIKSNGAATYDEVEEKIGAFKYECEPIVHQADGLVYFRCFYDLRGDRILKIVITFTSPEKAVLQIDTPMGYDGE
jgi:hypothetical protein